MQYMIDAFLGACGAGVLTLLVMSIKWMVKKMKADDLTMKALAHDAYFRQARYLLMQDAITEDDLENHNYLYRAYHSQGLNGTGDEMHRRVLEKKIAVHVPGDVIAKLP